MLTVPDPVTGSAAAEAAAPVLARLQDVHFGYDQRTILDGVSMDIPRGRLVAIMGNSGSGKTTILRLLGGQVRAASGCVEVDGADVGRLRHAELYALRRRMGMLFQFGALFTDISVFDNVAFPLREHTDLPESMIRDLVLMKLEAVGLRGAAGMPPSALSGGMARRVALARAIALDPMLMLYDEPFTGLDPISVGVIANLIRSLNDALGATSIIVTHDVEVSFGMVDHVYLLSSGRIIADGTPEQIRASADPYVQQFVRGQVDGPVRFHYPAADYASDLGLGGRH
jgi:phospholipid/cholesterol/gamma-HCH transport system ATP-binding protein